jgi:hypothetical protein
MTTGSYAGCTLYVSYSCRTLRILDTATNTFAATVPVASGAQFSAAGVSVHPGGDFVYVAILIRLFGAGPSLFLILLPRLWLAPCHCTFLLFQNFCSDPRVRTGPLLLTRQHLTQGISLLWTQRPMAYNTSASRCLPERSTTR